MAMGVVAQTDAYRADQWQVEPFLEMTQGLQHVHRPRSDNPRSTVATT